MRTTGAKGERMAEPHVVTVSALGSTIAIRASNWPQHAIARLEQAWSGAMTAGTGGAGPAETAPAETVPVEVDAPALHTDDRAAVEIALSQLSGTVTLAAIEAGRGRLLMLHAAALAAPDGRVIALVGPSGRGKTTAALTLGRQFAYVTDECCGVAADGTVLPYRKPLSVIDDSVQRPHKAQRSPDELGLMPLPDLPLRLAAVAVLDRDPAAATEPAVLMDAFGDAVEHLVPQISALPALPDALHRLRDTVGVNVPRIRYREAEELPEMLRGLLAAPPPPRRPALWTRGNAIDAMQHGDALLVLLDGTVQRIEGIAPIIWQHLSVPRSLDEVVDEVVARIGAPDPGDPVALVEQGLESLRAAGVVRRLE